MALRTNTCNCCGTSLLRHVRQGGVYWFCSSCWQEVPVLSSSPLPRPEAIPNVTRTPQTKS